MATTTNYGWTTPDNTAYVKDGAAAIRSLGSAVDTTSATTNAAGLVFIKSQTIGTAVASVTVTGAFNATYDSYRIVYSPLASSTTGSDLRFRYRTGGTDNATANYNWAGTANNFGGTTTNLFGAAQTSGFLGYGSYTGTAAWGTFVVDVVMPFLTQYTSHESVGVGVNGAGAVLRTSSGGFHGAATSFDGITFLPSAGTITGGTISVYGYRKAI